MVKLTLEVDSPHELQRALVSLTDIDNKISAAYSKGRREVLEETEKTRASLRDEIDKHNATPQVTGQPCTVGGVTFPYVHKEALQCFVDELFSKIRIYYPANPETQHFLSSYRDKLLGELKPEQE